MEQLVRVVKCNDDGTARVVHIRESACSGDCHKCSGCGAAKQTVFLTAYNPIGAKVRDTVIIEADSGHVLAGAAVVYLVPLALFIGGYLAGEHFGKIGVAGGVLGLFLGIGLVIAYDRLLMKKRKTIYTIRTRIVSES